MCCGFTCLIISGQKVKTSRGQFLGVAFVITAVVSEMLSLVSSCYTGNRTTPALLPYDFCVKILEWYSLVGCNDP